MYSAKCHAVLTGIVVLVLFIQVNLFASEMDDRIESAARQSYVFKIYLTGDTVAIQSRDGVVTLTGTVSAEPYKLLARETVASLPGVKSVDSRLVAIGEIPDRYKDAWLVTKVKSTLMFHRNLNATEIEVSAKDGAVTLRGGQAISSEQKNLATEYAKDVEGVVTVANEMTVLTPGMPSDESRSRKPMDDASITALVKVTLLYHRSTSALEAVVETKQGVVELRGKAGSTAEKERASKLVNDVYDVKRVVNNMTVEETESSPN
jgi:osmotically-inducible protein OsmY